MIIANNKNKDNLYNFFVRYFDYFIIIFVIVFGVLVYNFYFKNILNEIRNLQDKKINLEQEIYKSQANYLGRLKEAKENLEAISTVDVKRINSILPSDDEKILLFYYLDKLVKDNDLNMQFIKFSNLDYVSTDSKNKEKSVQKNGITRDNADKYLSRLKINMRVSGVTYDKLKLLLGSIENNLRLMDVEFFNFSSLEDGELNISATAYYEPDLFKTANLK